ncbi:MAG: hypothetical protein E7205_02310 [Tissierellaceae bacterium]|nr:hypothetical protein [Tissierellaceae bacterium]
MLFARFQGTKNIETESYYVDLLRLYEDSFYLDQSTLYKEWEFNLKLRKHINPKNLFNKVISSKNFNEVRSLAYKYKVDGVFSYNIKILMYYNNIKSIDTFIEFMVKHKNKFTGNQDYKDKMVQNDKYLIIFDGKLLYDFGADGCLTKMNNILKIKQLR